MEWINKYWSIILAILTISFYFGFTKAEMQNKVDKTEVAQIVKLAIDQYKTEMDKSYIEIDRVPGLNERLKNIEEKVSGNTALSQKIYDIILGSK